MKIRLETDNQAFKDLFQTFDEKIDDIAIIHETHDADVIVRYREKDPFLGVESGLGRQRQLPLPVKPGEVLQALTDARQDEPTVFSESIAAGEIELIPDSLTFKNNATGRQVILTEKEYHLLYVLTQSDNFWMSKKELLREVWGYDRELDTHTLETHIYRLRRKIELTPSDPQLFLNEDQGYRLAISDYSKD